VNIIFQSSKLQKDCVSLGRAQARYGTVGGKRLMQRLDEIRAASTLEDLRSLPQARCHELVGDMKGQVSVDLNHPYRLIFVPANDPVPTKPDGGLDWGQVTAVLILGVEDTHG
jgi:plasmid maintenance system killer protein